MCKIGIVSCDKWKNKISEDLLLKLHLESDGIDVNIISWEDQNINYNEYDALILKSVWGYQDKYYEFTEWLSYLKNNHIKIYNSVDIIENNIKKDVQFSILDKYCIPHIESEFQKHFIDIEKIKNNSVIKPIISGSGNNTFIISEEQDFINKIIKNNIKKHFENIMLEKDNGIIIQPFIKEIINGEYSCIFIDGINTHNMLRFPGVFSNKQKPKYAENIPNNVLCLANKVMKIPEFSDSLYMRIDIVLKDNKPLIMEVELAEPDLLIKYITDEKIKKESIKLLTKKIESRI